MIYLDNAATSFPKPPGFAEHGAEVLSQPWGNPFRGSHRASQLSQDLIERVRQRIARMINAPSAENIIIGSSTTQLLNLVLRGIVERFQVSHAVSSEMEHNSVLRPLYALAHESGMQLNVAAVDERGQIDLRAELELALAASSKSPLLVLAHAVNTVGWRRDLGMVSRMAREYGAWTVIDAAQSLGGMPIDVQANPVDAVAFGAHKGLLGPTGLGFLYLSPRLLDAQLQPQFVGGGGDANDTEMPRLGPQRFEAGTPNLHALALLEYSLDWSQNNEPTVSVDALSALLREELAGVPGLTIYGREVDCRGSGIVLFNLADVPAHTVAHILDSDYGIAVRAGLHCAPLAHRRLGSAQTHQGAVRVSFGKFNTVADCISLAQAIKQIAAQSTTTGNI